MCKSTKPLECPYCNEEVDLDKKLTFFQKSVDKKIHKMLQKQGINEMDFPHQDYFCSCKAHLTIIKNNKGENVIISSSPSH